MCSIDNALGRYETAFVNPTSVTKFKVIFYDFFFVSNVLTIVIEMIPDSSLNIDNVYVIAIS